VLIWILAPCPGFQIDDLDDKVHINLKFLFSRILLIRYIDRNPIDLGDVPEAVSPSTTFRDSVGNSVTNVDRLHFVSNLNVHMIARSMIMRTRAVEPQNQACGASSMVSFKSLSIPNLLSIKSYILNIPFFLASVNGISDICSLTIIIS
jgi:hypothetical protein